MHSSIAVLLLGGLLAAANPVPQGIDVALINDTPDPTFTEAVGVTSQVVSIDLPSIQSAAGSVTAMVPSDLPADSTGADSTPTTTQQLEKRASATCAPQALGKGPLTTPDDAASFTANIVYSNAARTAQPPACWVQTFQDEQASNNALGYLGYTLLSSYDVNACAAKCTAISNNACMAFNLYFERNASLNPNRNSCLNPPSTTYIKCAFWGGPISIDNAVNKGQYRGNFQVVIAGSNSYVSTAIATPAGYKLDKYYANKAVDATYDAQGYKIFLGSSLFTGPFMAQLCAARCDAQTVANLAASTNGYYPDGLPVQTCMFFSTYVFYKNTPVYVQGQYCSLYSALVPTATDTGNTSGQDKLLIQNSYTFVSQKGAGINLSVGNKDGAVRQASSEVLASTRQPFCSSLLGYTSPAAVTVSQATTLTPIVTSAMTITVSTVTVTASSSADVANFPTKRSAPVQQALFTPTALSKYPATVVSSACSLAITPITSTSTTTVLATATASTSIQVISFRLLPPRQYWLRRPPRPPPTKLDVQISLTSKLPVVSAYGPPMTEA